MGYRLKSKYKKRAGRPSKSVSLEKQLSIRFPPQYYVQLLEAAEEFRIPMSMIVRNLVMDYLDNLRKENLNSGSGIQVPNPVRN